MLKCPSLLQKSAYMVEMHVLAKKIKV